jgi:hypothetical protein
MMHIKSIPTMNNFQDLSKKAKYDFERFKTDGSIYSFIDCLLTLNALPDWIKNSEVENDHLNRIIDSMQHKELIADKILTDIDDTLRFIRFYANHSKHNKSIKMEMSAAFPLEFPIRFKYIQVGELAIDSVEILKKVIDFWDGYIKDLVLKRGQAELK